MRRKVKLDDTDEQMPILPTGTITQLTECEPEDEESEVEPKPKTKRKERIGFCRHEGD